MSVDPPPTTGELELTIEALGTGGAGLAHHAGRPLFVEGTVPGERVRVRTSGKRVELLRVLQVSSARKTPECTDAAACGGCDWMHLAIDAQAREHVLRLERLLATPVTHHPAPEVLGYRTRLRLHVKGRHVGYFRPRSKTILVPRTCHVAHPTLEAARLVLTAGLEHAALEGELSLALGASGRAVAELVLRAGEPSGSLLAALDGLVTRGELAGVRVLVARAAPLSIGAPAPVTEGADGAPLILAPGGFAQSAPAMNRLLAGRVLAAIDSLGLAPDARIFETHAGAGNFSVALAARSTRLETFETSALAVAAARANLAARGLGAKLHETAAEQVVVPKRLPLLVLDPPREGAKELLQHARDARTQAIVYVSCEPTTLARDRAVLGDAYRLERLEAFEMFPQTSHVETMALLRR